jgi:hypothetical protein
MSANNKIKKGLAAKFPEMKNSFEGKTQMSEVLCAVLTVCKIYFLILVNC